VEAERIQKQKRSLEETKINMIMGTEKRNMMIKKIRLLLKFPVKKKRRTLAKSQQLAKLTPKS